MLIFKKAINIYLYIDNVIKDFCLKIAGRHENVSKLFLIFYSVLCYKDVEAFAVFFHFEHIYLYTIVIDFIYIYLSHIVKSFILL